MSAFKFYISYPTSPIAYSEFLDITEDVLASSVSNLKQQLSSNEYDVGSIKFNKIKMNLANNTSKFSEANNPLSIFSYKRDESILKIEWDRNVYKAGAGNFPCGHTYLSIPRTIYEGFLEDNSSKFDADNQFESLSFLGLESIIGKVNVDFSALSVSDNVETTIFKILNQSRITNVLTVDQGNIGVAQNFTPDSIVDLEDKTCLEALNEILYLSGAILYVKDRTIFVKTRESDLVAKRFFYGAASNDGIEDVISLEGYTPGLNRTFNFWKWADTSVKQSFVDSIETFGVRQKVLDSSLVTNGTTQLVLLASLLSEFGFPKVEFQVEVPLTTPNILLFLLDRISVDVPADYQVTEDGSLPARYGQARYGEGRYVKKTSSLVISPETGWKIMNREISIKNHSLTFRVREI